MLVRIRSRDGNFRFELNPTDDISVLVQKILETSDTIDPETLALSNAPRGGENLVSTIVGDLDSLGISHGDLLFVSYTPREATSAPTPVATTNNISIITAGTLSGKVVSVADAPAIAPAPAPVVRGGPKPWETVVEDEVDTFWDKLDGKIHRKKGGDMCKCGPKAMCDYCMPLEPFDSAYQAEHSIKHLSYHSYLRKAHASAPLSSQSTSFVPPLSDPSYKVVVPCTTGSHPSWPQGICTKCQPSAVTLSRQTYRLVDHVEFAQPQLIEGLLNFWRLTGTQRFGYLLGRYEKYEEVPMGIKAVVEAIHEPPQEGLADGVTVGFPWEEEQRVERLASACGLKVVGMIYTDLVADTSTDEKKKAGKVLYRRHANSFFLSSLEVIFSAHLQQLHPSPSKYSSTGHFSSKFVTCVLSGDSAGGIAVEAYQVSDQAVGMVESDMIEASVDPSVVRVKEEESTRYIPDVFFRYKNKYGIEVKESAKPCFPVEYLLVNVTNGFPKAPTPTFKSPSPFPVENRIGIHDQSMAIAAKQFLQLAKGKGKDSGESEGDKVATWLSDWHLLAFLDGVGIFDTSDTKLMAQLAIAPSPSPELLNSLVESPSWKTFLAIAEEEAPSVPPRTYPGGPDAKFDDGFEIPPDVDIPPDGNQGNNDDVDMPAAAAGGIVVCPHCTFENSGTGQDCEICGLPLQG